MNSTLSSQHSQRFEEIKKNLQTIGYKESQFLKVELLFFETLSISRSYGNDPEKNSLLAALKRVQNEEYTRTTAYTKKPGQRELVIKKFVVQLKKVLSSYN